MEQHLRVLAAIPEDWLSIPSTLFTQNHLLTPVLGNMAPSSGLYMHCTKVIYRHTCRLKG